LRAAAESGRKGLRDAALASLRDMAFTPESAGDRAAFFVLVGDFEGAVRAGEIAGTALIGAISSRDATRRREAASALGKLKLSSSVNPLLKLLRDHDPEVQRASADALIEIGGSAIEGLMALLECPDPSAQRESARALGRIADPRAAGPLVELIRGNRRTTGDYPEPLEAARAAAESLITILTRSADSIPPETLARIAEVPDCIVVQGQAGVEEVALDCSPIRKLVNRDTDGR
jgi:HEAT repeat protein